MSELEKVICPLCSPWLINRLVHQFLQLHLRFDFPFSIMKTFRYAFRCRKSSLLILFQGILSVAYLSLSGNVFSLINCIAIVYWLAIGCATAALFWLRRKMPDAERPIKVLEHGFIVFLFSIFVWRPLIPQIVIRSFSKEYRAVFINLIEKMKHKYWYFEQISS